ncbi:MAG: small multi-drug export protein, partial [Clostridia bacterium]|nr:small multi-drug export protein [Clostridia bacterium]
MTETIVSFFESITQNDYLTLFLVSIIPIIELRGALILSAGMNVNPFLAFLTCVAGSSCVIIPLIVCVKPIIRKLKTTKFFHKLAIFAEDILADKAEKVKKSSEKGIAKRAS